MREPRPNPVPLGRTAQRLTWPFLPPNVRSLVERRCGSPVVDAESQGGGFTPGFASVLTCVDGTRHFVKAASAVAQPVFADSYREEARKLGGLSDAVPAPRLLWSLDDDWVVLGIEHVDARLPRRPWSRADLDRVLATLAQTAAALTPPPEGLALDTFADEYAAFAGMWDKLRAERPDLQHIDEAQALAVRFAEVTAGDTLVHTDVRDDNILLGDDGRTWLCDWNWPVTGAAWLDTVFFLVAPRGDGHDVDALLAELPLTRDVPAESIDVALALVTGYFLRQAGQPVPPTSPHLRAHQGWYAEVCWDWLSERRGWSA
ncbi:phosphotransferase [Nocardioides bigeumensis]|uniref:Aminoglycoside phosphotransferase domain-containing protein n=1 Tax=Nocardioides bigeumensis TaxID=433657 RepID=A0ABN2Y999_9ACTN